jgi:putative endonuclease
MPSEHTQFGFQAESAVCRHLEQLGYRILDRNWRRPWGELDIVARLNGVIHFVEVKASSARIAGFDPVVRADPEKMRKVLRTARTWLAYNRIDDDTEWQLDVASVIMRPAGTQIELLRHT